MTVERCVVIGPRETGPCYSARRCEGAGHVRYDQGPRVDGVGYGDTVAGQRHGSCRGVGVRGGSRYRCCAAIRD